MRPDRDLDRELWDLGAHVEYPPTPDLAGSVKGRLDTEDESPAARSGPLLWWATAAAAALVLVAALSVLSPAARDMAAGVFSTGAGGMAGGAAESGGRDDAAGFGEEATEEESDAGNAPTASSARGAQEGSAAEASSATSDAATARASQSGGEPARRATPGETLGWGERITLREARARSEAPILLPRSPKTGKPDEVYDRVWYPGFTLLYRAGPGLPDLRVAGAGEAGIGLLLTETPGDAGRAYLRSGTVRGQGLETASVGGRRAYWVPPREGRLEVARDLAPSTGVLLWERGGRALRIEAGVPKEEAVRIAESVR